MTDQNEGSVPEEAVEAAWEVYRERLPKALRKDYLPLAMHDALAAALAAALPFLVQPQVGIGVKALEWEYTGAVPDEPWAERRLKQWRGHHHLGRYAGSYSVQEIEPGGVWGWWNSWTSGREPEGICPTEIAAKAAAQADYEARINSALSKPLPSPQGKAARRIAKLEGGFRQLQEAAALALHSFPEDSPISNFLASIHRFAVQNLLSGEPAENMESRSEPLQTKEPAP